MKPAKRASWGDQLVAGMTPEQKARLVDPVRSAPIAPPPGEVPAVVLAKPARAKEPNKTERRWMLVQEARANVKSVRFEAVTFVIDEAHGRRSRYTPDLLVVPTSGPLECHETKGAHVFDGARERFALARRLYPWFVWVWAQYVKGQWHVETFNPEGAP